MSIFENFAFVTASSSDKFLFDERKQFVSGFSQTAINNLPVFRRNCLKNGNRFGAGKSNVNAQSWFFVSDSCTFIGKLNESGKMIFFELLDDLNRIYQRVSLAKNHRA